MKALNLIFCLFTILINCGNHFREPAQIVNESKCILDKDSFNKQAVYTDVDQMPKFIGGEVEMLSYIKNNFNPSIMQGFDGSFKVAIIIDKEGEIINAMINNKNSATLNQAEFELIKVFKNMPKWVPGKCDDKEVNVKIILPIKF